MTLGKSFWRTLVLGLLLGCLGMGSTPVHAQNQTCPTAALGDNSNKCASTAFAQSAVGAPLLLQNFIFVGGADNVAHGVPMSGDCAVVSAGIVTCLKTNGVPCEANG